MRLKGRKQQESTTSERTELEDMHNDAILKELEDDMNKVN
jgi:hypothetical protein